MNESTFDNICDQFEASWKNRNPLRIEDLLEELPADQRYNCLHALLEIELEYRLQSDQAPKIEDYIERFPDAPVQVNAAFQAAAARVTTTPDDPLAPTVIPKADSDSVEATDSLIGRMIGPYKLLQRIGKGGMGEVYMADQSQPVKRRVALKVIKTDTPTKEILARFEAERQALAMMDHQNIAKVLDAGVTEDGRPYFAMELVKGIPITEYCDKNKLTPNERLELFVQVCRAIQHAHMKGIIHRDIKPSNVLVTLYDGKPVAKVIDFGLAKALQETNKLTDRTLFTQYGQVVGTLAYMSPEQAEMNALDVDTRTDVYSLGVILYELLTGSTPITREKLRSEAFDRILAMIREEEAPRPSQRLSNSGDQITGISEQRKIEPKRLSLLLKSDLDWIVVKALEKDRIRRYDTPASLADDVANHLNGNAIEARPPSAAYRLRKFVRRNRVMVGAVSAGSILLVTATMISAWFAIEANHSRGLAVKQSRELLAERNRANMNEQLAEAAAARATANAVQAESARRKAETSERESARLAIQVLEDIAARLVDENDFARAGLVYIDVVRLGDGQFPMRERVARQNLTQILHQIPKPRPHSYDLDKELILHASGEHVLLEGGTEGTFSIQNLRTGRNIVKSQKARDGKIHGGELSSNARYAAILSSTLEIWELSPHPELIASFDRGDSDFWRFEFSQSEEYFVVQASNESSIELVHLDSGDVASVKIPTGHVFAEFSPGGTRFVTRPRDELPTGEGERKGEFEQALLWDTTTKQRVGEFDCNDRYSLSFSPNDRYLYFTNEHLNVARSEDLKIVAKTEWPHRYRRSYPSFSSDSQRVCVSHIDSLVSWDLQTKRTTTLRTQPNGFWGSGKFFAADHLLIIPVHAESSLVLDAHSGQVVSRFRPLPTSAEREPTLRGLEAAEYELADSLGVQDLSGFAPIATLIHEQNLNSGQILPVSEKLLFSETSYPGIGVQIQNMGESSPIRTEMSSASGVLESPDGQYLLALERISESRTGPSDDGQTKKQAVAGVYDTAAGSRLAILMADDAREVYCAGFDSDSKNAFVVFREGGQREGKIMIQQWNLLTFEPNVAVAVPVKQSTLRRVKQFTLRRDGVVVCVSSALGGNEVLVTEISGQHSNELKLQLLNPIARGGLTFSPDGSRLVITTKGTGGKHKLHMYDTVSWKLIGRPLSISKEPEGLRFSRDNQLVAISTKSLRQDDKYPGSGLWNVELWNVECGLRISPRISVFSELRDFRFDKESNHFLALTENGILFSWDIRPYRGDLERFAHFLNIVSGADLVEGSFAAYAIRPADLISDLRGMWKSEFLKTNRDNWHLWFADRWKSLGQRLDDSRKFRQLSQTENKVLANWLNWRAAKFERTGQWSEARALRAKAFKANQLSAFTYLKLQEGYERTKELSTLAESKVTLESLRQEVSALLKLPRGSEISGPESYQINQDLWNKVVGRSPAAEPRVSSLELQLMRDVVAVFPLGIYYNTLGIAEYRAGNFKSAIEACQNSAELTSKELYLPGPHPGDLAFLAMSHFKLGNQSEADRYKSEFVEAMKHDRFKDDTECLGFANEVEDLFVPATTEKTENPTSVESQPDECRS